MGNWIPQVAIVGLGGYATEHHRAVMQLEAKGESRLVATCDPDARRIFELLAPLKLVERGITCFSSLGEMLERTKDRMDLLIVPTPLPLHARMHQEAVFAGVPLYLEKPPTLDPEEFEQMLLAERNATRATWVGFNFTAEPTRRQIKDRLLAGEFGQLQQIHVTATWPRSAGYFERSDWSGRLRSTDGALVLDSCLGNAMSHFVHNALHWSGIDGYHSWDRPATVRAALYRAHAIESADTAFVESQLDNGPLLRLALTHAGSDTYWHAETLHCEKAEIRYVTGEAVAIRWRDGRIERPALISFDPLLDNHRACYAWLRGETSRPATTLEDCRGLIELNALAFVSSETIQVFPEQHTTRRNDGRIDVRNLAPTLHEFLATGRWPTTTNAPRIPALVRKTSDLAARLRGTVDRMVARTTER